MKIYAAVIEWGAPYEDTDPDLILARSESERFTQIKTAVRAEYESRDGYDGDDWTSVLADLDAADSIATLTDWIEAAIWPLQDLEGPPHVATYEKEV